MMLINGLEKAKRITEEEKQRFIDVIQDENRKPKEEEVVFGALKKEFAKCKLEGKHKGVQKEGGETSETLFIRNSRFDNWKKSGDFKNFQRSELRPRWFRTNSRLCWMKPGSQP